MGAPPHRQQHQQGTDRDADRRRAEPVDGEADTSGVRAISGWRHNHPTTRNSAPIGRVGMAPGPPVPGRETAGLRILVSVERLGAPLVRDGIHRTA